MINQYILFLALTVPINSIPKTLRLTQNSRRMLDSSQIDVSKDWEPIRIDFIYITDQDPDTKQFLDNVFSIAGTFFQKHLLVRRPSAKLTLPSTAVLDFSEFFTLPSQYLTMEFDSDLVVFVGPYSNNSDGTLAACSPIVLDKVTQRPTIAAIIWNMAGLNPNSLSNADFEANVGFAVHEMIHGLGFISDLFPYFYDSVNGTVYQNGGMYTNSDGVIMLLTPRVNAFASKHFNCSKINGIPMENQGGDGTEGSHWERVLLYNEIMTGSDMVQNFVLTDFTLQFLQDTGYYRLASYTPDILPWGQGQGCNFYSDYCNGGSFNDFCSEIGVMGCSHPPNGIGYCLVDQIANSCPYVQINSRYDCRDSFSAGYSNNKDTYQYFGFESMCIEGGFSSNATHPYSFSCYQYECGDKFLIKVNGQSIDCTSGGNRTLVGIAGQITCPENIQQFCAQVDDCPNQCNKRGFCMKRVCTCIGQYYGAACELEGCAQIRRGIECVSTCQQGEYFNSKINYCIGCPGNCATCTAYNSCTTCNTGYELRGGFCDSLIYVSIDQILHFLILIVIIFL